MSDIHGNMEALKAVKKRIAKQKIEKMILLGDIIDYGPHSNEVISYLNTWSYGIICNIRGNHEEAIINNEYSRFSSDRGRDSARYTRGCLDSNSWQYINEAMAGNTYFEFVLETKKCLAVHGSLIDTAWKAIVPSNISESYTRYDYVFSGHSHLPHVFAEYFASADKEYRNKSRTMFVNPGSVGQPRNHNPRAQFIVWNTETDEFEMCGVEYDIKREQSAFSDSIDVFYRDRLELGI